MFEDISGNGGIYKVIR